MNENNTAIKDARSLAEDVAFGTAAYVRHVRCDHSGADSGQHLF